MDAKSFISCCSDEEEADDETSTYDVKEKLFNHNISTKYAEMNVNVDWLRFSNIKVKLSYEIILVIVKDIMSYRKRFANLGLFVVM